VDEEGRQAHHQHQPDPDAPGEAVRAIALAAEQDETAEQEGEHGRHSVELDGWRGIEKGLNRHPGSPWALLKQRRRRVITVAAAGHGD
jgi:hypothetical protein